MLYHPLPFGERFALWLAQFLPFFRTPFFVLEPTTNRDHQPNWNQFQIISGYLICFGYLIRIVAKFCEASSPA